MQRNTSICFTRVFVCALQNRGVWNVKFIPLRTCHPWNTSGASFFPRCYPRWESGGIGSRKLAQPFLSLVPSQGRALQRCRDISNCTKYSQMRVKTETKLWVWVKSGQSHVTSLISDSGRYYEVEGEGGENTWP